MELLNINVVYFSATNTTRKVVRTIAEQFEGERTEYNITQHIPDSEVLLDEKDLLIVGMPVYSGRIPGNALTALSKFKSTNTPAIIACVYGNRDYDDALLELKDIVEGNGFKVISAGAFVAQHSIFPQVGHNRPDEKDLIAIRKYGSLVADLLSSSTDIGSFSDFSVKGNRPYKVPGKIPLRPKGNRKCDECGTCVKLCPTGAIPSNTPRKTDKGRCIACGRCIVVCPQHARHFGGILYKIAGRRFVKANLERKEPVVIFSNLEE